MVIVDDEGRAHYPFEVNVVIVDEEGREKELSHLEEGDDPQEKHPLQPLTTALTHCFSPPSFTPPINKF